MEGWRRIGRRLALAGAALGTAAALVGAASFALFTSTATAQQDTFAAGTVILGTTAEDVCTVTNIEPGDQGQCTYTVTYSGSLNAWVALDVYASSVATRVYTPPDSQTPLGGEALLNDGSDANGLAVTLNDTLNNNLAMPTVTCPNTDSSGLGAAEGSGSLGSASACEGSNTQPLSNTTNAGDNGTNDHPYGSWAPGQSDTITVDWKLPLSAPNTYQGSSAEIVLQADAVQASNNGGFADGFETPVVPGSTNPDFIDYVSPQSVGPWQVTSGSVDLVGNGYWQAAQGSQSLDLSGTDAGTIATTIIPTVPGQTYVLRFAMSGNPDGGPAVKTMNVLWDSNLAAQPTFDTSGISRANMGWVYKTYTVVATGASSQLSFVSTTNSAYGPVIDAVSVTPAP